MFDPVVHNEKTDLYSNEKEVVGYDLEQVLFVLAQQHQPKGRVVDREPEETLAVGPAGEPVVPGLGRCKGKMSILGMEKRNIHLSKYYLTMSTSKTRFWEDLRPVGV